MPTTASAELAAPEAPAPLIVAAPKLRLACERPGDAPRVEALIDAAFGPGRFAKTAERLREGAVLRADLSFCAWSGGVLVGAVRLWPVEIGASPAAFLGPIAVEAAWRRRGLGALLVERACEAAEAGDALVLLVGDGPFFGPLGFEAVPKGRVVLPGPVDPRRILWRALKPDACEGVGGAVRVPPPVTGEAPPSGLAGVVAAASAPKRGPPPVHLWNPAHCGEIDIRIRKDGLWIHEGTPIGREPLVRLFASVLRLDPDGFHLVTPVEKLKLIVEDAPFIGVRVDRVGEALRFLTNVGDEVEAGPENAIRVTTDPVTGEPAPYLHVRRGLEARLSRPVFYELVEMADERDGRMGIGANSQWFDLGPAA